jgi:hypothetical protein
MADDLVTVAQYQFLAEAEAARMRVGAEGISAFLSDAETLNANWLLGNAIGYIKLQVPRSQAEAAQAVLREMRGPSGDEKDASAAGPEMDRCLACGATLHRGTPACSECGWSYADGENDSPRQDSAGEEDEGDLGRAEKRPGMDWLRSLKRPVFLIMLVPTFFGIALFVLMLLLSVGNMLVPFLWSRSL